MMLVLLSEEPSCCRFDSVLIHCTSLLRNERNLYIATAALSEGALYKGRRKRNSAKTYIGGVSKTFLPHLLPFFPYFLSESDRTSLG